MSQVVERMAEQPESLFFQEHVARYNFALRFLISGSTLDLACGTGYGTDRLAADSTRFVVGIDLHTPSLIQAHHVHLNENTSFLAADGTQLPFAATSFSNIVTLETIEHIADDQGFLTELARILRPDGVCVLSTPNREYSLRYGRENPFHIREYEESELLTLLNTSFASVELYYQGFAVNYYDRVANYTVTIQQEKKRLPILFRLAIDYLYKPIKQFIPSQMTNTAIHLMLKQQYPQPSNSDIIIMSEPTHDYSVIIAICRQPRLG